MNDENAFLQAMKERPEDDGLLFAAGQASVRQGVGRFLWPALSVGLALVAVGLGIWGHRERIGRLALIEAATAAPQPPSMREPPPASPRSLPTLEWTAGSYRSLLQALEADEDGSPHASASLRASPIDH